MIWRCHAGVWILDGCSMVSVLLEGRAYPCFVHQQKQFFRRMGGRRDSNGDQMTNAAFRSFF